MDRLHRVVDKVVRRRRSRPGGTRVAEEDEVLHVALRSRVPRVAHALHRGAPFLQPAGHAPEHVAVDGGIPYHPALADALPAGLELRLDQHEAAEALAQAF